MKVKVSLSSEDGQEWTAESKDIGLITTGASMESALEAMQKEIREFFHNAFGSPKQVEVVCSKIKANAYVTVSPLEEPRPERPLDTFIKGEPLLIEGQDLIDGPDLLALPSGEGEAKDNPNPSIIDIECSPVSTGEEA